MTDKSLLSFWPNPTIFQVRGAKRRVPHGNSSDSASAASRQTIGIVLLTYVKNKRRKSIEEVISSR